VRESQCDARRILGTQAASLFSRCEHCNTSLVVNRAAAGMRLRCQDCGKLTAVPKPSEPAAGDLARLQGIQRRLTENESQRTEATSYINQLNIQLHGWQLRPANAERA